MPKSVYFLFFLFFGLFESIAVANDLDVKKSRWNGFERHDFKYKGVKSLLVIPDSPAKGYPWVWRARFFGHQPQADIELLKRGFHLAYCDVAGLFGNQVAVERWNEFYQMLITQRGLSKKPALEGMSRGGLIIYNWASVNPEKVSCIYGDAPVCDIRSWPGGKGKGKGGGSAWKAALKAHRITDEESKSAKVSPIHKLKPIANAGIPILHVVGAADKVVPVDENSEIIEKKYKELGGNIHVISKPGIGHHPHALKDPRPIVDFILKHSLKIKVD